MCRGGGCPVNASPPRPPLALPPSLRTRSARLWLAHHMQGGPQRKKKIRGVHVAHRPWPALPVLRQELKRWALEIRSVSVVSSTIPYYAICG